jgi:hypothetical protein
MTQQQGKPGSSFKQLRETHSLSGLMKQLDSAITESDVAITVMVDSFLTVVAASNVLARSSTCSITDREVSNLIQKEVSVITSTLQFQDLLKQRLEFIKAGLEELSEAGVEVKLELKSELKTTSGRSGDGEVTLFSEAA